MMSSFQRSDGYLLRKSLYYLETYEVLIELMITPTDIPKVEQPLYGVDNQYSPSSLGKNDDLGKKFVIMYSIFFGFNHILLE